MAHGMTRVAISVTLLMMVACGPDDCENRGLAYGMSQEFIKRQLKAPSTASFPSMTADEVKVSKIGKCQFGVIAYVDAQNSFGAKLRSAYTMKIRYDPADKKWYGTDIDIR